MTDKKSRGLLDFLRPLLQYNGSSKKEVFEMLLEESILNVIVKNSRRSACFLLSENMERSKYLQGVFQAQNLPVYLFHSTQEILAAVNDTTRVVMVDATGYGVDYSSIFTALRQKKSDIVTIALLPDNSKAYQLSMLSRGVDAAFAVEQFDELLAAAVRHSNLESTPVFASIDFVAQEKEVIRKVEENPKLLDREFNRRSFLKGSAAAASMVGVATASPGNTMMKALAVGEETKTAVSEEKVFAAICRGNCTGACQMNVYVRDGKIVKTSKKEYKNPEYNRICQRGRTHAQFVYNSQRIKYPMRRVGERGAGKWEQISWDEAISEICSKWKNLQAKYGNESVAFFTGGGNYANDCFYYGNRLQNYMGGSIVNITADNGVLATLPRALGYGLYYGGNSHTDLKNAKNIFCWGNNTSESQHVNWHFVTEAQRKGSKLICIDPNYTIAASKSDKFVPIRPATDALLAMAMTKIVIDEGLADEEYLKKHTVAPFLVKESDGKYLRLSDLGQLAAGGTDAIAVSSKDGKVGSSAEIADPALHGTYTINNINVTTAYDLLIARLEKFTPENAAYLCDIPLETITELARTFANGPSTIYCGYGPNSFGNGHYAYHAMYTLAMVTGNMGKPGCGLSGGFSFNLGAGPSTAQMDFPADHLSKAPTIPAPLLLETINSKKYNNSPIDIRSLYIYGSNPMGNQTDRNSWIEVFNKLDFVVVAELVMSDSSRYADIVLPVSHWFEMETFVTMMVPYANLSEKVIDPLYESKADFDIINLLAKGMGFGEDFPISREQYMTNAFNNDLCKGLGLSYEKLKQEKQLETLQGDYIFGKDGAFATETGRAQFYLENVVPNFDYGQKINLENERLPYWEPPHEAWHENELFKKYPLIFTTERNKFRVHCQFGYNQWLTELWPEPFVRVNPKDAEARGIKHGDVVKFFNDRGYVVAKAYLSAGTRPGMVVMPKGWQEGQFIDGHYSDITSRKMHPCVANNAYFDTLVEMKKM